MAVKISILELKVRNVGSKLDRIVILLLFGKGCRVEELVSTKLEDVDTVKGEIHIHAARTNPATPTTNNQKEGGQASAVLMRGDILEVSSPTAAPPASGVGEDTGALAGHASPTKRRPDQRPAPQS